MESDTADIDAQIAALQAKKAKQLEIAARARREREKEEAKVLINSTPTKVKKISDINPSKPSQPSFSSSRAGPSSQASSSRQILPSVPVKPSQSKLVSSLATLRQNRGSVRKDAQATVRASSFYSQRNTDRVTMDSSTRREPSGAGAKDVKGKSRSLSPESDEGQRHPLRDDDSLTIINNLELGPKTFGKDPEGEDAWEHVEPNSRIRLNKRLISHELLQDHLQGRYFLPPSLLYSVIRLSRDGATYDVPVDTDWITIAVVAERGEIRVSGTKEVQQSDSEDEDEQSNSRQKKQGDKEKSQEESTKDKWKKRRGPRKYINMKLVSLPPRSSTLGGKAPKGDAVLSLLLFEADAKIRDEEGDDVEKTRHGRYSEGKTRYQGGSGGAYEKWCNLTEGTVIALLNPRILRPLKSGSSAPHPLTLPLALNPTSADSIMVIGQARDLGRCNAEQKDGNRCKTWVDLRQGQVCEYHVHAAVSRGRAGRAEFTASTSGFSLSTRPSMHEAKQGGGKFNPYRKQGLLPNTGAGSAGDQGATYVVGGKAIHMRNDGGLKSFGDEHLSERLGRGRAERKRKRLEEQEAEEALSKLLKKDGQNGSTGAKYLAKIGKRVDQIALPESKRPSTGSKGVKQQSDSQVLDVEADRKRPFNVQAVRRIGFDPTARPGQRDDEDLLKRQESIASLKDPDRPIRLDRPKGTAKSNVRAVPSSISTAPLVANGVRANTAVMSEEEDDSDMIDLD